MRVLQIHNRYRQDGGEDTVVRAESRLLAAHGHEVVEHRVQNPDGPVATAIALGLSAWNPIAAREIARLVANVRPDVTHVHNTWFRLSGSILGAIRSAGSPVVMTLHNYRLVCANAMLLRDGEPCDLCVSSAAGWHGIKHKCYRGSSAASAAAVAASSLHRRRGTFERDVDVLIATSDFLKHMLIRGGVPQHHLTVKHHFTSDPGARPRPPSSSSSVVFVGRLSPGKGLDVLIDAWGNSAPQNLTLEILGDGELRKELQQRAGPRIKFVGPMPRSEVLERILRARALIAPSVSYETFGMVLIEAMACGAPVIASDVGAFPEVLAGLDHCLVPAGDRTALGNAIAALSDDDAVDRAGTAARAVYEQRYTEAIGIAALETAYRATRER